MSFQTLNFQSIDETVPSPSPWYRQGTFWLTLLLNSAACLYLTGLIVKYQTHPFDGDEVNHALPSLTMAQALGEQAWLDFLRIFYDQSFYPPAMAGLKALLFLLFDPSFFLARLFSVICLFLAILLLYTVCVEIDPQDGGTAGLVTALLTLSSSLLLINATLSMVEIPGLMVSLLTLWAYVRALKKGSSRRLLLASFMISVVFLTKYSYGMVVVLALGLTELTLLPAQNVHELWPALKSSFVKRWVYLFGPFFVAMVFWFLRPDNIEGFFNFTQPLPSNEPLISLQNAGSYLRSIAIHNLPAPEFAVVTAGAMVWTVQQWSQRLLRPLFFYFVTGMGMIMLVNHPVNTRFIITFVPALYILTGLMIACLWRQRRLPQKRVQATIFLSFIGLAAVLSVPNTWRRWTQLDSLLEVMVETDSIIDEMVDWMQQQVPPGESVFLVNYWDQLSPNLFAWYQGVRSPTDMEASINGIIMLPPTAESLAATRQTILNSPAGYLMLFEGGPLGHPFWPEYTAALEDVLVPVARREFTVTHYREVQNWLDTSSVTEAAWPDIKESYTNDLSISVIIYKLEAPLSFRDVNAEPAVTLCCFPSR